MLTKLIDTIRQLHDEGSTYKDIDVILGLYYYGFRSYILNRYARKAGY